MTRGKDVYHGSNTRMFYLCADLSYARFSCTATSQ
jgi:hypothetical protein